MKIKKWNDINWTTTELELYNLQRLIYINSADESLKRKYQKELVRSEIAKLVSIRKITQDNRGKNTVGASIYNGKLEYFSDRVSLGNPRVARMKGLFKKQKNKCSKCGILFKPMDIIEIHHQLDVKGKRNGNLKFVHGHCHDDIHGTKPNQ